LLGDEGCPEPFWEGVVRRGDPRLDGHSMCGRPDWKKFAIPYAIHGDAVPVTRVGKAGTASCDVVSSQSLLQYGSSLDVKNVIFAIFLENVATVPEHGVSTMDRVWKIIHWSLFFTFLGVWPTCDWQGNEWTDEHPAERALAGTWLADGFFAVVWLLKGDLDYFAKHLHLRSYSANVPCDFCPCDKDRSPGWWPSNFAADALWNTSTGGGGGGVKDFPFLINCLGEHEDVVQQYHF